MLSRRHSWSVKERSLLTHEMTRRWNAAAGNRGLALRIPHCGPRQHSHRGACPDICQRPKGALFERHPQLRASSAVQAVQAYDLQRFLDHPAPTDIPHYRTTGGCDSHLCHRATILSSCIGVEQELGCHLLLKVSPTTCDIISHVCPAGASANASPMPYQDTHHWLYVLLLNDDIKQWKCSWRQVLPNLRQSMPLIPLPLLQHQPCAAA